MASSPSESFHQRQALPVGSRLAVTGVYEVGSDEYGRPCSAVLHLRSWNDAKLLHRPPWWNATRLLWLLLGVLSVLLLALVWGILMSRKNDQLRLAQSELQRANDKLELEFQNRQLQKSESLGRMAGAIAHHFNNQLQAVMMNLAMAMKYPTNVVRLEECLADAIQSTRKASEVSTLMLTYLGHTVAKHELLDLCDLCQKSLAMLRVTLPKEIILEADLLGPGPVVRGNASQIQQILSNLMTNAWEAAAGRQGIIGLSVKQVGLDDIPMTNRFPVDCQLRDGAYACLEVSDSGSGIPSGDIDKLFDPFFSSKFTGRGLGLPVVLGIVRAHRGVIVVKSELGYGSVFRIYLPVSTEAAPAKPVSVVGTPQWTGTVLVADDEKSLLKAVAMAVKELGFTVLEAQDGVQAVELFRRHQDEIVCVLCDTTMPRMDGWETLTALRQLAPNIPVILASGYSEAQVMAGVHPHKPQAFLSKPYEFEKLKDAITQVLRHTTAPDIKV